MVGVESEGAGSEGEVSMQVFTGSGDGGGRGGTSKLSRTTNFSSQLISVTTKSSGLGAYMMTISKVHYFSIRGFESSHEARVIRVDIFMDAWIKDEAWKLYSIFSEEMMVQSSHDRVRRCTQLPRVSRQSYYTKTILGMLKISCGI